MTVPGDRGYDNAVTALRSHIEDLAIWITIWEARKEPDAHARRCASNAVDAIDAMLQALHKIRARLISEVRVADDQTAARIDKLLAGRTDAMTSSSDQASPEPAGPAETKGPERCNAPAREEGKTDAQQE